MQLIPLKGYQNTSFVKIVIFLFFFTDIIYCSEKIPSRLARRSEKGSPESSQFFRKPSESNMPISYLPLDEKSILSEISPNIIQESSLINRARSLTEELKISGNVADFDLKNSKISIYDADYILYPSNINGKASHITQNKDFVLDLQNATYSTCNSGANIWKITSKNIVLDPSKGFGKAKDVILSVKNIPIFYTPYIQFPLTDRRQSGFLVPTIKSSNDYGIKVLVPYYLNLKENYDLTLYPHFMTKKGLLLESSFRYLGEYSKDKLYLSYIWTRKKDQVSKQHSGYMLSWQHVGNFKSNIPIKVNYSKISNPYYLQELEDTSALLYRIPSNYLHEKASISYIGDSFSAELSLDAYQLTRFNQVQPYNKLPQIVIKSSFPYTVNSLNFEYDLELTRFTRNLDKYTSSKIEGDARYFYSGNGVRLNLTPSMSFPIVAKYGYIKPTLRYNYAQYWLEPEKLNEVGPIRSIPMLSIDSKLVFDRDTQFLGRNYRNTLETRLMYLYVPRRNQSYIPIFDTAERVDSYSSLWKENRFLGGDRMSNENKISMGLTSHWINYSGSEIQSISLGRSYSFNQQNISITMPPEDSVQTAFRNSPYYIEYLYKFDKFWNIGFDYSWHPRHIYPNSGSFHIDYESPNDKNKLLKIRYINRNIQQEGEKTRRASINQHELSLRWPLSSHWVLISEWQHDYTNNSTIKASGGLKYTNNCWNISLVQRYSKKENIYTQDPLRDNEYNRGIFIKLTLNGLNGFSKN